MEFKLSFGNTMTLKKSYTVGDNYTNATYKIPKGNKDLFIRVCSLPDSYSKEQINELLKDSKVVVGDNLDKFLYNQ